MNFKLIDFTIKSLKRRLIKKLSVIFIFSLLVFLLVSVFSISSSIKKELQISVDALPEIIVQKMSGGRQSLIPVDRAYEIATIPGVQNAYDRVWGYYHFVNDNVNFTIVGLDFDLIAYKQKYSDIESLIALKKSSGETVTVAIPTLNEEKTLRKTTNSACHRNPREGPGCWGWHCS